MIRSLNCNIVSKLINYIDLYTYFYRYVLIRKKLSFTKRNLVMTYLEKQPK
jgi:hypothetical protein